MVNHLYVSLAQPHGSQGQMRIVPKYRGDLQPFDSHVGEFAVNEMKQNDQGPYLDHGQVIGRQDWQKLLQLNQKPLQTHATANDNLAFDAPMGDGVVDMQHLSTPQGSFDYDRLQKPLEQHSQNAHDIAQELRVVDTKQAEALQATSKYQVGQYDAGVVDAMPKDYWSHVQAPKGIPTNDTAKFKSIIERAHPAMMTETRSKADTAMKSLLAQKGGSLLKAKPGNHRPPKRHQNKLQVLDPLSPTTNANFQMQQQANGQQLGTNGSNVMQPHVQTHQELLQNLNQSMQQAMGQRYHDQQNLTGGNNDPHDASVFEQDYEPKNFADAESALAFNQRKKTLGLDTDMDANRRNKYLQKLLATRQAIEEANDASLVSDNVDNIDRRGTNASADYRRVKKDKNHQQSLDKRAQKVHNRELYVQSLYAMRSASTPGGYQYNLIARERPNTNPMQVNAYASSIPYQGLNGKVRQSHSINIDKSTVDTIMAANGLAKLNQHAVGQSLSKGQPLIGKHDNVAFTGQINQHQLDATSIRPTQTPFNYDKEIVHPQNQATSQQSTLQRRGGLTPKPEGLPHYKNPSNLINPLVQDPRTSQMHADLVKQLDAALSHSSPAVSTQKQNSGPSLG